jgi:hypothetical protein
MIIYLGLRMLFGNSLKIKYIGRSSLGFWVAGLIMALVVGVDTGMDFRHTSRVVKDYQITAPKGKILYIDAIINQEVIDDYNTFEFFDGYWKVKNDLSDHTIYGSPWIEFQPGSGDNATVAVYTYAQGSQLEEARQRAVQIDYEASAKDSVLTISSHFRFPDKDKIRVQRTEVDIEIPVGQKVMFTEKMKLVFEDGKNWEYRESEWLGKTLIMTNRGLRPFVEGMSLQEEPVRQDTSTLKIITRSLGMLAIPLIGLEIR